MKVVPIRSDDVYAWRDPSEELRRAEKLVSYAKDIHDKRPLRERCKVEMTDGQIYLNVVRLYEPGDVDWLVSVLLANKAFLGDADA